jgi:hypothetical protein
LEPFWEHFWWKIRKIAIKNQCKIRCRKNMKFYQNSNKKRRGNPSRNRYKIDFFATARFREFNDYSWTVCLKPRLGTSKKQQKMNDVRKKTYETTWQKTWKWS